MYGCRSTKLGATALLTQLLVAALLLLSIPCSLSADSSEENNAEVFRNQYIIEPVAPATSSASDSLASALASSAPVFHPVRSLGKSFELVAPAAATALSDSSDPIVPYDPSDQFCADLIAAGLAKSCTPNFVIRAFDLPNDPLISELWGFNQFAGIDAEGAWAVSTGSDDVVVAVLDTGIDQTHPDLVPNLWTNPGEIPNNGLDDDGNGFVDDVHGAGFVPGKTTALDDNGHGTHVSGTIGARGNNGVGVTGVNWNVRILPLKVLDESGAGSWAAVIEAIEYMLELKQRGAQIKVVNASWGGGVFSSSLRDALARLKDAGIVFVAAAGNESRNNDVLPVYPAGYDLPNIISVAALDPEGNIAPFSNYGSLSVDVAAPGVNILSTLRGGGYGPLSGTSMATPIVSGMLALLASAHPDFGPEQLIATLDGSVTHLPTLVDLVRTQGKVNAAAMMQRDPAAPLPTPWPKPDTSACTYNVEEIGFAPDRGVESKEIAMQADEAAYILVPLPFQFPFHRRTINVIKVSPNGVIYLVDRPPVLDYKNDVEAPENTIAALHTDLVAASDPYGVRVRTTEDRVTVYWKAKYYKYLNRGDVAVHATLFSDGKVEVSLSVPDPVVEHDLQRNATIGLRGDAPESAFTFDHNSPRIRNGLSIRFTPMCNTPLLHVDRIVAYGRTVSGRRLARGRPGKFVQLELLGQGSGQTSVSINLGNRQCTQVLPVTIVNGHGTVRARLPRSLNAVKKVRFAAMGASTQLRISERPQLELVKTAKSKSTRKKSSISSQCRYIAQSSE